MVARRQDDRVHRRATPQTQGAKDRKEHLGDFEVVRREYTHTHLWTLDVAEALQSAGRRHAAHEGQATFSVGALRLVARRNDGSRSAPPINPDLIQGGTADIYLLDARRRHGEEARVAAGAGHESALVARRHADRVLDRRWAAPSYFATNSRLAVVPADGGTPRSITDAFDEEPGLRRVERRTASISRALQKTASHLFRVDPATGAITRVSGPDGLMAGGFSLTRDGTAMAFTAASPTSLAEVYVVDARDVRAARS